MPGVHAVVRVGDDAVAVVADTWWRAKTALDALPITWDEGPNASLSSDTIDAFLEEGLTADEAFIGNQVGDAKAAIAGAAQTIEADYSYPFQNHATMEPMNATAIWTSEKCEGLVPNPKRRGGARGGRRNGGAAGRAMRRLQDSFGRRVRSARRVPRFRAPSGADRKANAGNPSEASMVARRRHDARPLPSDHQGTADRRTRRQRRSRRPARPLVGPIDLGRRQTPTDARGRR